MAYKPQNETIYITNCLIITTSKQKLIANAKVAIYRYKIQNLYIAK